MEDIPVHLLSSFVHFANSKNISEAAKKIGITQPALSKQLALLEAKIQQPLFMQRGRNKVLSPFGSSLNARLKNQIGGLQEAIREEKNLYSDLSSAKIRIAGRRGVLDRFSAKLSFAGRIDFYDCPNELAVENILTLQADIGITHFLPNTHHLMAKKLFLEKFLLVVPKKLYPKKPELNKDFLEALIHIPCIAYKPRDVLIRNFIVNLSVNFLITSVLIFLN